MTFIEMKAASEVRIQPLLFLCVLCNLSVLGGESSTPWRIYRAEFSANPFSARKMAPTAERYRPFADLRPLSTS